MLSKTLQLLLLLTLTATASSAWQATAPPPSPQVIYLWPSGSATLKGADEKEITTPPNPPPGARVTSIINVHNPSIEVRLPPPDKATGTAIIVAPGGGHRQLVWGTEGVDIADWLNSIGIAAINSIRN